MERMIIMNVIGRYDRQIRLWGEKGQIALEKSWVYALGSSVAISETLKNLVLAGIHGFTIVDDAQVGYENLASNFFFQEKDVGSNAAEILSKAIVKLNSANVSSQFIICNVDQYIKHQEVLLESLIISDNGRNSYNSSNTSNAVSDHSYSQDNDLNEESSCERKNTDLINSSIIIGCLNSIKFGSLKCLEKICNLVGMPLIIVQNMGFYGLVRIYAREHLVFSNSRESYLHDLRIIDPFDELQNYAMSINLSTLDDLSHQRVPYVIILIQALNQFRDAVNSRNHWTNNSYNLSHRSDKVDNNKNDCMYPNYSCNCGMSCHNMRLHYDASLYPKTKEEKEEFIGIIKSMQRIAEEPNFQESLQNSYRAFCLHDISSNIMRVFNSVNTKDLFNEFEALILGNAYLGMTTSDGPNMINKMCNYFRIRERFIESFNFWLMVRSLLKFWETFKRVPVNCTLPDMVSDTNSYIMLQKIYRKKHNEDILTIIEFVKDTLQVFINKMDRDKKFPASVRGDNIDTKMIIGNLIMTDDYMQDFFRNIDNIDVINYSSVVMQFTSSSQSESLKKFIEAEGTDLVDTFILMWAKTIIHWKHNQLPISEESNDVYLVNANHGALSIQECDERSMIQEISTILTDSLIDNLIYIDVNAVAGFLASASIEFHPIASFIGGIACQEGIKLITHQFVPLNNTYIYDGLHNIGKCLLI